MTRHESTLDEAQARIDLAAALRLACRADWHESVANHFSVAISADGKKFLVNPRWMHWSRVRASDLVLCDADDKSTMSRPDAPDPSAWSIHSALHRNLPQARVALHLHPPYATALAALKDPTIHPIDQVTARFYKRLAYDLNFGGIATAEEEGERIANAIGDKTAVMIPQGEDFSSLESELNLADAPPSSFWIASSNKEGNFTVNRAQYFPRDGRLVTEKVSLQKKKRSHIYSTFMIL